MIAASIVLLYVLVRRKGAGRDSALAAVVTFGLAHALFAYKLEYPWDGVDVLLFLAFGAWAASDRGIAGAWPLLVVGALNHETVVYIPLWYLLAPLDRGARRWRDVAEAAVALALLLAFIAGLRNWLYVGRPVLPGQVFEKAAPLVENHIHVAHNVYQLVV